MCRKSYPLQFLWEGSSAFSSQPCLSACDQGYKQPSQYCHQQVGNGLDLVRLVRIQRQCSKKHEHWAWPVEGYNNAVIPRHEPEVEATREAGVKLLES